MTALVRKSCQNLSRQPALFLSLNWVKMLGIVSTWFDIDLVFRFPFRSHTPIALRCYYGKILTAAPFVIIWFLNSTSPFIGMWHYLGRKSMIVTKWLHMIIKHYGLKLSAPFPEPLLVSLSFSIKLKVQIPEIRPEIVMVDGIFFDDSFEQDRLWDDSGTTISGI